MYCLSSSCSFPLFDMKAVAHETSKGHHGDNKMKHGLKESPVIKSRITSGLCKCRNIRL